MSRFVELTWWRSAVVVFCLLASFAGAWQLPAQDAGKTRAQLEAEIEERRQALEKLEAAEKAQQEEAEARRQEEAEEQAAADREAQEDRQPEADRQAELEETPRPRHRRDHQPEVMLTGSRTVAKGETAPGIVLIGGFLEVEKGAQVEGDSTVVGGGAKVDGLVHGTLVVVGGSVELGEEALIEGDLIAVGGHIRGSGNGRVEGQKVQIAFGDFGLGPFFDTDGGFGSDAWPKVLWGFSIFDLIGRFFRIGLLLLAVCAVLLLAPGRAASIAALVGAQPWRSGLIGLLSQVVFLPVFLLVVVILLVSIIGIPLVLVVPPLMVLAMIVFLVMGYAGVAMAAGRIFERRFDRRFSTYALALLGLVLIEGWSVAGELLLFLPGPIKVMALLALAFGFLVQYLAWTVGLGAAISDQAQRRRLRFAEAGTESGFVDHFNPE